MGYIRRAFNAIAALIRCRHTILITLFYTYTLMLYTLRVVAIS